ncbi:acyl-CoA dehydrogenase family protein [Aquabacterium sp. OR-4]|uniref:acyl-CoA dehydrogenase family protein n=1 Tax=Aquabacterium sp. OR-4 TaxID=2978127 RepID=UPI0021B49480|nr:acyl-CoA dehydrogenase family protein [Aquabacterium sp. OR-4]MDT7837374.1 acyl-CoA dehydrogenase family protein [Aquabacterium sp. OR-4]
MDFEFTDDQVSLRDAVAKWVDKGFDFSRRHALAKAGGKTRAVYAELAELGLTGMAVPEAHGGMAFGAVEAMVVMEELGRGLVNAPFAAGALMSPVLLQAAPAEVQAAWLPKVADASALVVPALQERAARYKLSHVTTTATPANGGWQLSGQKSVVPAADEADAFIVPARLSGGTSDTAGIGLFLVEQGGPGVSTTGYATQDGGRAGELKLANATATLITTDGWATLEQAVDVGIAAACAEGVGAMDRMVAITVDYMNTRKQFGTTLATFQALRHRIADVKMQLELGRSMSFFATLKLGEAAPQRRRAISQAKVQLGNSMRFVGQHCTQIHGGIGVTDEYISSHYFKRLTMLEMAYGDTLHHLGEVSERMQDTAGVFA